MKRNLVKQKLRDNQATYGTWITLDSLHSARVLARSGFDWLTLDLEHSAIDWSRAAAIVAAVADAGGVPLVRVPVGDQYCIKRALDAGAWGIVVPMVDTPEQARSAIAAAKKVGRPLGIHTMDPNDALRRAGQGMQFLAVGTDLRMMSAKAEEFLHTLRRG